MPRAAVHAAGAHAFLLDGVARPGAAATTKALSGAADQDRQDAAGTQRLARGVQPLSPPDQSGRSPSAIEAARTVVDVEQDRVVGRRAARRRSPSATSASWMGNKGADPEG